MILPALFALAATYQQCTASTTCTIGEYLYNDSYQPLTGAACTLTAKYPDGTTFLNGVSLTGVSDGWYSYDASIGTTEGLYHANICCTSSSEYLCLDKSFEVKAAAGDQLTAADVWGYSSRTLTSFGDLAKDVWSQSTRTLTSFGDLVANIWSASTTTTTSGPAQQITLITQEQTEQRVLLEKLVNAPVVSLSLEEGQTIPDLNSKLEQSQTQASVLRQLVGQAREALIAAGTDSQALTSLMTLFDRPQALSALTAAWQDPVFSKLELAFTTVRTSLLSSNSGSGGLAEIMAKVLELGDTLDDVDAYLAQVRARDTQLLMENQKLAALLEDWNGQGEAVLSKNADASRQRILALNQFPGGSSLIEPTKTSDDNRINLKNIVFNLQALLGLNRQILAMNPGEPIRSLWLAEGSIIFRGVITNPSTVISQTVPLKFYLPRELTTSDIISLDSSLETHYDTTEEALYVTGSYTLRPEETRLIAVEVEDIWKLSDSELESLRKQASELLKPLEKTAFFSQGTVLKSEIEVTLDKIILAQSKAITPENRIRAFREAKLELNGLNSNMDRLQDLVAEASGTGSIFGFVGGVQAVAVWGILLIVIASFVFLTIYMRQLKLRTPVKAVKPQPKADRPVAEPKPAPLSPAWLASPAVIALIVVATAVITVAITQLFLRPKTAPEPTVLEVKPASPSPLPLPSLSPKPQEVNVKEEKQVLGEATPKRLTVPSGSSVNVRTQPDPAAPIVMTIKTSLDVFVFASEAGWSRIGLSQQQSEEQWWISSQFLD